MLLSATPSYTLDSSNYPQAAREALQSAQDATDAAGSATLAGGQISSTVNWAALGLAAFTQGQGVVDLAGGRDLVGATASESGTCVYGGTYTISVTDANNNSTLDAGDSFTIGYNQCATESSTSTLSGNLTFVMNAKQTGSVSSNVYSLDTTMTFDHMVSTDRTTSTVSTANGDMRVITNRTAYHVGTDQITSNRLEETVTVGSTTTSRTLTGMTETVTFSTAGASTVLQSALTSSVLGGKTLVLKTTAPILKTYVATHAYAGTLVATGANGATLTITAIDANSVRLDLDSDGNGTVDKTDTRAWSTFD